MILAFDVRVERDAQEMADSLGVKIFLADIIYHLFDNFLKHRQVRVGKLFHVLNCLLVCISFCHDLCFRNFMTGRGKNTKT